MALTKDDLQAIAGLIQPLREDIHLLKNDVTGLKTDVTGLKADVAELKTDVAELKTDVVNLKKRVSGLEIHLENVTDKNIQIIAEGHLDLNRKLDEALKVENEKELLTIRVRILEDELRKIKEHSNLTA